MGIANQVYVDVGNAYVGTNAVTVLLQNTSTLAVSTPIEVYTIAIGRPDTTNPPTTTPTGIYS